MAEDKFENTEQATPRKLEEARGKGEVAKSKEVPSAAIMVASLGVFYFFGETIFTNLGNLVRQMFLESGTMEVTVASANTLIRKAFFGGAYVMLPFFVLPLVGLAANVLHIGFVYSTEPLVPKLSKINPLEGLKKLVSPTTGAEFLKSLLKFSVMGFMAYTVIRAEAENFGQLADADINSMVNYLGRTGFDILIKTSWVIVVIAIIDYAFQRWEWSRNLKMSKHEVKEEFKDTEGQPMVKTRIRTLQRQLAMQRMMDEVPEATVVVTNPTHFAVAIKYEQGKMGAPVVVAKGADHLAAKIKEVAREHNVPIVENKTLARTLWKVADIGSEVPQALYQAIAEVLAYVYRLKGRL